MNRDRINQILTVLLFPFCDPELGERDCMLQRYLEYEKLLQYSTGYPSMISQHEEQLQKYNKSKHRLAHYLEKRNEGRIRSYDDLMQLCELYYPLQEVRKWMEKRHKDDRKHKGMDGQREWIALFYLKNLDKIADSLITYRDGVAAIRTWNNRNNFEGKEDIFCTPYTFDKVEVWNLLCRFTVPDIYIISFVVKSNLDIITLFEQTPFISLADKLLVKCLRKGLAENHLHFNVGFDYAAAWLFRVNPTVWYSRYVGNKELDGKNIRDIQVTVFRILTALFLKESESNDNAGFLEWLHSKRTLGGWNEWCQLLRDMDHGNIAKRKDVASAIENLIKYTNPTDKETEYDYLLETVYRDYIELKTSSEFIWLYFSYSYITTHKDAFFAHLFIQYLRIKNNLFQKSQETYGVRGLKYFREYFNSSKQLVRQFAGNEDAMLEVFRAQSKITALKKLEIRIAPSVQREGMVSDYDKVKYDIREQLCIQLHEVLYVYRRYILENLLGVKVGQGLLKDEERYGRDYCAILHDIENLIHGRTQVQIPVLGIVYHFLKTELTDNATGYFCWRKLKDSTGKYSNHGVMIRKHMENIAKTIEWLRSTVPVLDQYIVGVDAASDENAMEPWMFAPVYLQMRSRNVTKPVMAYGNNRIKYYVVQNVGFTYHVGEDFRHIVSGLRHIDEVIEQFHYKPGDRLGHAIALGVDIKNWVQENEVVAMPVREYMENMLWMWGKNVYDGVTLPIQLENLEEQILNCIKDNKIYNCSEGITVRMLYESYKMKFISNHWKKLEEMLDHEKEGKDCSRCNEAIKGQNKTVCYYSGGACNMISSGWNASKLLCTNYCPVFEEKYEKVVLISVRQDEAVIYECLQEYLLKKTERCGIYVETNPTSNVTIGEFHNLQEHPIFRMNNIRRKENREHHVMVTINSDDPAVFNTNVENELAYIYYAAEHEGYAKEDVLKWIDEIRQNGLEASFIQKEKGSMQILREISTILDNLKKLCR